MTEATTDKLVPDGDSETKNPKGGEGQVADGSAKAGSPDGKSDDWFNNSQFSDYGASEREALASMKGQMDAMSNQLENAQELIGQQSQMVGQSNTHEQNKELRQKYAEAIKTSLIEDGGDPTYILDVMNEMVVGGINVSKEADKNRLTAFSKAQSGNKSLSDVSYHDVMTAVARGEIDEKKITSATGMQKALLTIKASRPVDTEAVFQERLNREMEAFKAKLMAAGGTPPTKSPGAGVENDGSTDDSMSGQIFQASGGKP